MDCPRCTNDLDRKTDWLWECPACGLVEEIPVVVQQIPPADELRQRRDDMTTVAGLMPGLMEQYPSMGDLWARIYHLTKDMSEKYDDMAGGA